MASKRAATAYSIILLLGTAVLFVSSGGLGAIKAYLTMAIAPLIRDETDRQASEITGELKKLELRVADLEQAQKLDQVEALAGSLRALEQRVSGTERSINILGDEVFSHDPSVSESVAVSTIGPGYSIARTPHGVFLISASVVSPYLDGYKIRLKVGNMLSATMKGAKLHIKWGGIPATREADFDTAATFGAGAYGTADVSLTPAKPDDLKTIFVTITFHTVEMWQGR